MAKEKYIEEFDEWKALFPKEVLINRDSSAAFMQQLTTVTVSALTYLRGFFPQKDFLAGTFEGLQLKILKKRCEDPAAQFVMNFLQGAFAAMDMKYLHKLALNFYNGTETMENLLECIMFEYTYCNGGVTMEIASNNGRETRIVNTNSELYWNTNKLLSLSVEISQTSPQIPRDSTIEIRLFYTDDAPDGYQAPQFRPVQDDLLTHHLDSVAFLGHVETPFHGLVAVSRCLSISSLSINLPDSLPAMTESMVLSGERPDEEDLVALDCPCNVNVVYDEIYTNVIKCIYCNMFQHATCCGLTSAGTRPHCCLRCHETDPSRPYYDTHLGTNNTPRERRSICRYRRALFYCSTVQQVSCASLPDWPYLGESDTCKLLKLLQHQRVLEDGEMSRLTSPRKILRKGLEVQMKKFFMDYNRSSDVVERLILESSQHSDCDWEQPKQTDPSRERPSERRPSWERDAMDQFRRVMERRSPSQHEKFPLSRSHNPVVVSVKPNRPVDTPKRKIEERAGFSERKREAVLRKRTKNK